MPQNLYTTREYTKNPPFGLSSLRRIAHLEELWLLAGY